MKTKEMFPSDYFRHEDLNGQPKIVTIKDVTIEKIGQENKEKPVVRFKESTLGLVLNKVNTSSIEELYGDESDEWAGNKITLKPAKTQYQGKTVDCIRVGKPRPIDKVVEESSEDDLEF